MNVLKKKIYELENNIPMAEYIYVSTPILEKYKKMIQIPVKVSFFNTTKKETLSPRDDFENKKIGGYLKPSVQRLVHHRLDHPPILLTHRARRLGHQNADQLLFRVDPEKGAAQTAPGVVALGAMHTGDARALTHHETQPEGITLNAHQHFTGLHRCCDFGSEMVRRHERDRGARQVALAVQRATIQQHLTKPQVIVGGR